MTHIAADKQQFYDALARSEFNKSLPAVCGRQARVSQLTDASYATCAECTRKGGAS